MGLWSVLTNSIGSIPHTIVLLKLLWTLSTQPVCKYIVSFGEECMNTGNKRLSCRWPWKWPLTFWWYRVKAYSHEVAPYQFWPWLVYTYKSSTVKTNPTLQNKEESMDSELQVQEFSVCMLLLFSFPAAIEPQYTYWAILNTCKVTNRSQTQVLNAHNFRECIELRRDDTLLYIWDRNETLLPFLCSP